MLYLKNFFFSSTVQCHEDNETIIKINTMNKYCTYAQQLSDIQHLHTQMTTKDA